MPFSGEGSLSGVFDTMREEFGAQAANINALEAVDVLKNAEKIRALTAKVEALAANPAGQTSIH